MKFMALAAVAAIAACSNDSVTNPVPPQATVLTATGNITPEVDAFRTLLGASNGGTAGEQPAGRREINWDGVGANPFDNRNDFPADFFNTTVKSGAVFTTAGTGFRNDSTLFAEINPAYASKDGSSLGIFAAPVRSDPAGLSFLAVTFDQAIIARVRITLGTGALGANVNDVTAVGGTVDLVVLDNVIFGEPKAAF
ncbi:MAG: hypothetical protein M3Z54_07105 [Gemmatimonadota bacterium]|nr:hypothetical protein [Gemmatimonadota bacterium]